MHTPGPAIHRSGFSYNARFLCYDKLAGLAQAPRLKQGELGFAGGLPSEGENIHAKLRVYFRNAFAKFVPCIIPNTVLGVTG